MVDEGAIFGQKETSCLQTFSVPHLRLPNLVKLLTWLLLFHFGGLEANFGAHTKVGHHVEDDLLEHRILGQLLKDVLLRVELIRIHRRQIHHIPNVQIVDPIVVIFDAESVSHVNLKSLIRLQLIYFAQRSKSCLLGLLLLRLLWVQIGRSWLRNASEIIWIGGHLLVTVWHQLLSAVDLFENQIWSDLWLANRRRLAWVARRDCWLASQKFSTIQIAVVRPAYTRPYRLAKSVIIRITLVEMAWNAHKFVQKRMHIQQLLLLNVGALEDLIRWRVYILLVCQIIILVLITSTGVVLV